MPISLTNLQMVKDLLLFSPLDIGLDALVTAEWDQQRDAVARENDLFASAVLLDTTVGKAVYSAPVGTTKIMSVCFRGVTLGFTDAGTLDLRDPDWVLAPPGTPRFWSYNAVPPNADVPAATITPREFLITPAPDNANAGAQTLRVFIQTLPATVPAWLEPVLVYRTVAHICGENPNLQQPEKGEFFNSLAQMWLDIARKQMQV